MKLKEHYNAIIKLGIPIVIGQLGIVIVGMADNVMVGHYHTLDLAAASFVNNVFNIPVLFGLGFSYGLTPLVGKYFGKSDKFKIGQLLKNSLLVNACIGILLTLLMVIMYFNLDKLGQPEELMPKIRPYFLLHLASLIFVMLFNSFKQFSDGITDTRTPMFIMLGANLLNIIGNYVLIYGKLGLPDMGVVGAGISTLFSRILMVVAFAILFYRKINYRRYLVGYKRSIYSRSDILSLNKMGWMVGMQMGLETGLFSITAIMIGWLGSVALAAHQVVVTISTFGFMIYYGIGAAISVKVSNYFGRNDLENVRKTTIAGFHIILLLAVIASALFFFTRNYIGWLFTDSEEVVSVVRFLIYALLAYQLGDALQITFANALRGIGDVVSMAIISFIGYFIIALPVCYIFGFMADWGIGGVWIGYPVGLTLTGVMLCIRFYYKIRKH
ncbi:MATE family efflux transporter [Porphyromonadaceae bacterium OttesenSCG-928-L07]|nr:MATE family efflux transporter [Porphyromonadaceae bacterium OttesenSCG-928-L07]MDL2251499.1 MATE family efflux transporter [Odoribacter sp. OttesenSCG-928-J03]MDL2283391.1 MATE family efflux transporter [Odoribacter sp. OttesenSCG-928-G04]